MDSNFQVINMDEYNEFLDICKSNGFDPDDFKFVEHDISLPRPNSVGSITGKVTISKNTKKKTYNTGDGSSWPLQFENDLKQRLFLSRS
ncbi:TPA: hypothetical protein OZL36_002528 [Legionella pneumophila]|nr:hypothetical protein [Legionella pneumophila]